MVVIGLIALAASVYLVYVLEILKFRSFRGREIKQVEPERTEPEIERRVERDLETGEMERVK
jgi:UDP-GlcNAc:undecaprenyl-phosphate GlcNAc-1-phosphate transferase